MVREKSKHKMVSDGRLGHIERCRNPLLSQTGHTGITFDMTNRTFDVTTGNETTGSLNAFGQHVFGGVSALSPIDSWTLEFPLDDNPCLLSVSPGDSKQHDLGELSDVFLTLEYTVREN